MPNNIIENTERNQVIFIQNFLGDLKIILNNLEQNL